MRDVRSWEAGVMGELTLLWVSSPHTSPVQPASPSRAPPFTCLPAGLGEREWGCAGCSEWAGEGREGGGCGCPSLN